MTGTIDLSRKQFEAISKHVADIEGGGSQVVRLIIHPEDAKAVKVVTRTLIFGDVLEGRFFVLRDGTHLTADEFSGHAKPSITMAARV